MIVALGGVIVISFVIALLTLNLLLLSIYLPILVNTNTIAADSKYILFTYSIFTNNVIINEYMLYKYEVITPIDIRLSILGILFIIFFIPFIIVLNDNATMLVHKTNKVIPYTLG